MNLDHYRLLTQLGAGPDGLSYRAEALADGASVEVRILSGARADPARWPRLVKRLRLAKMLEHASVVGIREFGLDHDPPYLVMEGLALKTLAEDLPDRVPLPESDAVALAYDIATVLMAAHRLGLAHGRLSPQGVFRTSTRNITLDFTGIEIFLTAPTEADQKRAASYQPPEHVPGGTPQPSEDIYSLGALLVWLLEGRPFKAGSDSRLQTKLPPRRAEQQRLEETAAEFVEAWSSQSFTFEELLPAMLASTPAERPSIREVESVLAARYCVAGATSGVTSEFVPAAPPAVGGQTIDSDKGTSTIVTFDDVLARQTLGRYKLLKKLGQGGMGAVFRAEDLIDGTNVAVKVLRLDWAQRPNAVRRFHKEARLLAEVNNPFVANLLEVNEDEGVHFLAMEFVEGKSLGALLQERGRLDEATAIRIMADVARALVDAHERGIVHRDIKPDNILLAGGPSEGIRSDEKTTIELPAGSFLPAADAPALPATPHVKLTDFGLARHVVETDSLNVTQAGAIIGTPLYMSPEQCSGNGTVGPATDIYAMGATLFHLLAGRPPFVGTNQLSIINLHCNEAPPSLKSLNSAVHESTCQIVEKCLAKSPDARYPNAAALLHDLERVIRGEPTSIVIHPKLPDCDPSKVLRYDWSWQLEASPQQLWPHVSNTDRLNRAVGLPAVQFTTQNEFGSGTKRFGKFRKAGITAAWQEHPFEWIEARRMGVLRQYSQGPFKWMVSVVELEPRAGGGTTLHHRVRIEPSGLVGRTLAAVEVGLKGRRSVERVYLRIDAALTGKLGSQGLADPFEEPAVLSSGARQRLDHLLGRLNECGVDPQVVERFGDFLALAPAPEVARIRPLALARRLGLDPEQVVAACLHGAREGLLVLMWDILCPVCRIPSEVKDTLKVLRDHGRCKACNLDFELDFGNSVEMIFRAHPEIRDTELGVYCIGGPAHSPHVLAQVRVGSGERIELDLALPEGAYRLRGPQLPFTFDFRVQPGVAATRCELNLSRGPDPGLPRTFKAGRQLFALMNDHPQELVARIERTAARDDALTAVRASALGLFRELFPGEILSPGQLVSVANVVLVVTDLEQAGNLYQRLGDTRAFGLIHEHFRLLDERIRGEGGALIKTVGEGLVAAFTEPVAAVRAALDFQPLLAGREATHGLRLRVGVHRGPAMAATLNEHLDYFGTMVSVAGQLPRFAGGGEVVLTPAVAVDPQVAALLQTRNLRSEVLTVNLPGQSGGMLHRVGRPQAGSDSESGFSRSPVYASPVA
jgi:serine/threonine protein kinase/class 3 adenylate cyclase